MSSIVVRQVDRLCSPLARQFEERSDMAVVQLAGELQAPVDPHPDRLAEEFFGSNGRAELASLLGSVARASSRWATGAAFAAARLATGAPLIRDMIVDMWLASATGMVGYPTVNVRDIESGKARATRDLFGAD